MRKNKMNLVTPDEKLIGVLTGFYFICLGLDEVISEKPDHIFTGIGDFGLQMFANHVEMTGWDN